MQRAAGGAATSLALLLAALGGCSQAPAARQTAPLAVSCSVRATPGRPLTALHPQLVRVPGNPFATLVLPGGRWAVASMNVPVGFSVGAELTLLSMRGGAVRLVRSVTLPPPVGGGSGMALTHNGRLLLVAGTADTAVVSVARLEHADPDPVVGVLSDAGTGQYEVAVSADGRYVFVADEASRGLSVFNLARALRRGFSTHGVDVGIIPLGQEPVGVAVAPSGAVIYVTTLNIDGPGQLWAIDARRAEDGAGRAAVLAHVVAGCEPARVVPSPGGATVWVTALASNALLGFDAAALRRDPSHALRAVVRVGSEPVGLLLLDGGRTALVGDSNRYQATGRGNSPQISVVSTADALARRPAVTGSLPAGGLFPRDLSYDQATGQLLVPDFKSSAVEFLHLPRLPGQPPG